MLQALFGQFFYSHSPLLVCGPVSLVILLIGRFLFKSPFASLLRRLDGWYRPLGMGFLAGAVILIILNGFFPAIVWLGETHCSQVAFLFWKGHPIYHDARAPMRYSALYGPMLYLPIALSYVLFGASVVTAKLANTIFLLATVFIAWRTARALTSRPILATSLFLVILVPALLTGTPLIIFATLLAFNLYFCSSSPWRFVWIGLCMGCACNAKLNAGAYFLPILLDLAIARRFRDISVVSLCCGIAVVVPFCLPNVGLANYLFWLKAAAGHGLSLAMFRSQCDWLLYDVAVTLGALLLCLRHPAAAAQPSPSIGLRLGSAGAIVLTLIATSKPGSGCHHLFPLVPSLVILLLPLATRLRSWTGPEAAPGAAVELARLYLLVVLGFSSVTLAHTFYEILRIPARAIEGDLKAIMAQNPGARIVLGDAESSRGEWQSKPPMRGRTAEPLLLFWGHPYLYEVVALMDMEKAGLPVPRGTVDRLEDGSIDIWLFPKGRDPFNIVNWYDYTTPVFHDSFREAFFRHYEQQGTSEFYDIWKFRRGDPLPK